METPYIAYPLPVFQFFFSGEKLYFFNKFYQFSLTKMFPKENFPYRKIFPDESIYMTRRKSSYRKHDRDLRHERVTCLRVQKTSASF